MDVKVVGIDLGKNCCSLVGLDASGAATLRRRVRRDGLLALTAKLAPCIVAMEACCGAHHLARQVSAQGHTVRLMSPEYVRPYVKAQKNDDRDAEAIAEAATRPTMRFVEPKSEAQLDLQSLHRARDRLVGERTALINQIRALLLERGMVVPQGRRRLQLELAALVADETLGLSSRIRSLLVDMQARPTLGFPSMRTARATLKGFEVMRMFKKGQFRLWIEAAGGGTEVSFINRLFGIYA
jgi:transposase